MKTKLLLIMAVTIISAITGIVTFAINQEAQAQSSQQLVLTFGKDMMDKIDSYTYQNGEGISFSPTLPTILIENWGSVSATNQNQIINYATTHGWAVSTP